MGCYTEAQGGAAVQQAFDVRQTRLFQNAPARPATPPTSNGRDPLNPNTVWFDPNFYRFNAFPPWSEIPGVPPAGQERWECTAIANKIAGTMAHAHRVAAGAGHPQRVRHPVFDRRRADLDRDPDERRFALDVDAFPPVGLEPERVGSGAAQSGDAPDLFGAAADGHPATPPSPPTSARPPT